MANPTIDPEVLELILHPELEMDMKLMAARNARGESTDHAEALDRVLIETAGRARTGLREAQKTQNKLRALLEKLTTPPWHVATYLAMVQTPHGPRLEVILGNARHVVNLGDNVDLEELHCGDEVYMNGENNVVVGLCKTLPFGDTATFDRVLPDGRLVVRVRDEEVVTLPAGRLDTEPLTEGDLVRHDRKTGFAHEVVGNSRAEALFLEDTPEETFAQVGGLREQIEEIRETIQLRFQHPELARRFKLRPAQSILLVGPPGTGKTLLARALAHELAGMAGSGRSRFLYVKPGSLNSMWYGQTEQQYREVFRVAREAGERDPDIPCVIFFDEVDSGAAARGTSLNRVDDRVLTAFAAELDGLTKRGNILVVAATNRPDGIDPALLRPGRLGDRMITVPRPGRAAARDIASKHLDKDIPYAEDRNTLLDALVSHVYAPNGRPPLATIRFADGSRRKVIAGDLTSGAVLRSIADKARNAACVRAARSAGNGANGVPGLTLTDLLDAAASVYDETASILTRHNCPTHVTDLPEGLSIAAVERTKVKVRRPHRFLRTA